MKAVIQRVKSASVSIDNSKFSEIKEGLLVLLGVEDGDTEKDCTYMVDALSTTSPEDVVRITGLLHLLFGELVKNSDFTDRKGVGDSLYNRAINYISKNFCTDLTLGDMAKALGYHEKYLSSELHTLTHMNFRAFLSTYRVDHAKRLLRTTGINISEIALESGYSSINTFNRVFKENVGMTPSEYRRKKN